MSESGAAPSCWHCVLSRGNLDKPVQHNLDALDNHDLTALASLALMEIPSRRGLRSDPISIMERILDRGADLEAFCVGGTALVAAIHSSDSESKVKFLLERGAFANAICLDTGISALSFASARGCEPVVRMLLENGADPNIEDYEKNSALVNAVNEDHPQVIRRLIEYGADVNKVYWCDCGCCGVRPLNLAIDEDRLTCAIILVEAGAAIPSQVKLFPPSNLSDTNDYLRRVSLPWRPGTQGNLGLMPAFIKERALSLAMCLRLYFRLPMDIVYEVLSRCHLPFASRKGVLCHN